MQPVSLSQLQGFPPLFFFQKFTNIFFVKRGPRQPIVPTDAQKRPPPAHCPNRCAQTTTSLFCLFLLPLHVSLIAGLPIKQQFLQHSSAFGTTNHPITPSLKGVAPKQCSMALQQGHLPSSRILITGAAGFIGFHTARALWSNQQQSHAERPFLLGLDAFTPQPGPPEYGSIKRTRQQMLLSCCDITVVEGDIHNTALLHDLFSCYNFTQVVHLAGQAGVRQSVAAPTSYVSMNVEGTVSLLEVMRRQQMPPTLVYASSSSVYGAAGPKRRAPTGGSRPCNKHATDISNSSGAGTLAHCSSPTSAALGDSDVSSTPGPLPLAPTGLAASTGSGSTMHGPSHEQDVASAQPRSVYAASKLAVEHLVAVYHHQYKMSAVGASMCRLVGACDVNVQPGQCLTESRSMRFLFNSCCQSPWWLPCP